MSWSNRVILYPYDELKQGAVTVFKDKNCSDWSARFETVEDPTQVASYTTNHIEAFNIKDNDISSVYIPYGTTLDLYDQNGFIGKKILRLEGQPYMMESWTMDCINLADHKWNNTPSSLQVFHSRLGARARGRWTSITTTEQLKYTYHVGMTSKNSSAQSNVNSQSLNLDMSAGFEFMGASASVSVSSSWAEQITTSTQHDMTKDISTDLELKCTPPEGSKGGVGLWQFVVETGDQSVWTQTSHTVCRYDELYNVTPECPWNACANHDCSECKDGWGQ